MSEKHCPTCSCFQSETKVKEPQSSNCGDAPRKLERPADPRYGSTNELAWLIEMSFDGTAHWWYGSDFIADANQAVRFCRERDANQVIMERGLVDAKAVEHMWHLMPPESSAQKTLVKPTCQKHGVELAFEGDECWECKREAQS